MLADLVNSDQAADFALQPAAATAIPAGDMEKLESDTRGSYQRQGGFAVQIPHHRHVFL